VYSTIKKIYLNEQIVMFNCKQAPVFPQSTKAGTLWCQSQLRSGMLFL